jgi:hypothetical protein
MKPGAEILAFACASLAGCGGQPASVAAADLEPIRVEGAQFAAGSLPGEPPPPASADAGPPAAPTVIDVQIPTSAVAPGRAGVDFGGHASRGAQTIEVRFADLGTGYWIVPTEVPDPSANNALLWEFTADFGHDIPPGPHALLFAAVDANGKSGTQTSIPFCVDTPVPDNFNACSPKAAPPAAVLSLTWNTPVDLDLIVQTPTAATVGGKVTSTAPPGSSAAAASDGSNGVLDHDSNRNCAIDGIQREDIVWQKSPPAGLYEVWVDLFRSCGQATVSFSVSLWIPESNGDGGEHLVQQQPRLATGELLGSQANGGASRGLYVGSFNFR